MNREENLEIINELKSNLSILNDLEGIARSYHNQSIPHNLDKKVLWQIESLHEKLGSILVHLYMGDLEKKFFLGEIPEEEYDEIIKSTFAKYQYMTSSFLYDEKYIKDFSVKDKDFVLNLDKGSCYHIANGICSLDIDEKELNDILKKEFKETDWFSDDYEEFIDYAKGREDSILYCRNLAESIRKDGFKSSTYINHYKCDHYTFTDGQHRGCIASRLNIPLPANVSDMSSEDYCCPICENKIREQNFIGFRKQLDENRLNRKPLQKLLVKLKIKKYPDTSNATLIRSYQSEFIKKL